MGGLGLSSGVGRQRGEHLVAAALRPSLGAERCIQLSSPFLVSRGFPTWGREIEPGEHLGLADGWGHAKRCVADGRLDELLHSQQLVERGSALLVEVTHLGDGTAAVLFEAREVGLAAALDLLVDLLGPLLGGLHDLLSLARCALAKFGDLLLGRLAQGISTLPCLLEDSLHPLAERVQRRGLGGTVLTFEDRDAPVQLAELAHGGRQAPLSVRGPVLGGLEAPLLIGDVAVDLLGIIATASIGPKERSRLVRLGVRALLVHLQPPGLLRACCPLRSSRPRARDRARW